MLNGNRSIPYLCRFEPTLPAITIGIVVEVAGDADRPAKALALILSLSLSVFFFSFRLFLFLSLLSVSAARQLLASATNVDTTYTGDLEPRSTVHAYMRADCVTSLSCVTSLWECGCPWFPADFHITNAKLACAWYGCPKQIRR